MTSARKLFATPALIMSLLLCLAPAASGQTSKPSPDKTALETPSISERVSQADREDLAKMTGADPLSPLFRKVVKVVGPSVVEVRVRKRVEAPQIPPELEDFFRRFEDQQEEGDGSTPAPNPSPRTPRIRPRAPMYEKGLGSGTIVDAKNGYVLTNWHVVGGASEVEIILADGRSFSNEWVKGDPQSDLAVVKLKNPADLAETPLGSSDDTQVGDLVLAFGSPEGLEQTVTMGIISAKGRTTGRGAYESFLQTDAAVNHGNSGGPLVNMKGEIVGVTSAIVSRTGVNEGIGLAVPSSMAKNIMKQLIETGKVVRGFLGVAIQDNTPELAQSFTPPLPTAHGAVVLSVVPDSPAKSAGLKEDDIIVDVDGKAILNANELRNRIADVTPGQEVKLGILREGKKIEVPIKVAEQPADMAKGGATPEKETPSKKYGLEVSNLSKDMADQFGYDAAQKGVVITDVDPDSDAADKGLRAGWMIDRVNDKNVSNLGDFVAAVAEAKEKPIRLHVVLPKNGGKRYFVVLPK